MFDPKPDLGFSGFISVLEALLKWTCELVADAFLGTVFNFHNPLGSKWQIPTDLMKEKDENWVFCSVGWQLRSL